MLGRRNRRGFFVWRLLDHLQGTPRGDTSLSVRVQAAYKNQNKLYA